MDKHCGRKKGGRIDWSRQETQVPLGNGPAKATDCRGSRCDNRAGSLAEMKAGRG